MTEKDAWFSLFLVGLIAQAFFLWMDAVNFGKSALEMALGALIATGVFFIAWLFRITYLKGAKR